MLLNACEVEGGRVKCSPFDERAVHAGGDGGAGGDCAEREAGDGAVADRSCVRIGCGIIL